jgi:outer membrane protein assembly factor BamD
MFRKSLFLVFILLTIIFQSCGDFQKLIKSTDNEKKYDKAIEYYEDGDYYKALMLLEQLNTIYRGTEKAEKLNYYLAYCYYEQGDYLMASYYFKNYARSFPNTDRAEECLFMNAYCYYLDSPKYSLDQSNTIQAMTEFQLFINQYPDSERVEKANTLIDELRDKLELKNFEIAMLYYKMRNYEAAITTFENILKDFPDSQHKEEIIFYSLDAYFNYAINSISEKKKERFDKAMESYNVLLLKYPESDFVDQAQNIYKKTQKELENL